MVLDDTYYGGDVPWYSWKYCEYGKTIQSTKFIWISVPWYISNHFYHRIYHGTFLVSGVQGKTIALPCFLDMVAIVPPHNKVLSQLRFSTIPHQMNVNESIKLSPSRAFALTLHWLPLVASFNARPTPLTSPGLTADSTPLTRCQSVWDSPADALRGASIARSPGGPFHRHTVTHLLLGLVPEAQAGGPLLVPVSIIGARLVRLELHHLGLGVTTEIGTWTCRADREAKSAKWKPRVNHWK